MPHGRFVCELRAQKAFSVKSEAMIESSDEDDQGTTTWQVILLPLLADTQLTLSSSDRESWTMVANLQQKDPVICGRSSEPRRAETAELTIRTASFKEFL